MVVRCQLTPAEAIAACERVAARLLLSPERPASAPERLTFTISEAAGSLPQRFLVKLAASPLEQGSILRITSSSVSRRRAALRLLPAALSLWFLLNAGLELEKVNRLFAMLLGLCLAAAWLATLTLRRQAKRSLERNVARWADPAQSDEEPPALPACVPAHSGHRFASAPFRSLDATWRADTILARMRAETHLSDRAFAATVQDDGFLLVTRTADFGLVRLRGTVSSRRNGSRILISDSNLMRHATRFYLAVAGVTVLLVPLALLTASRSGTLASAGILLSALTITTSGPYGKAFRQLRYGIRTRLTAAP